MAKDKEKKRRDGDEKAAKRAKLEAKSKSKKLEESDSSSSSSADRKKKKKAKKEEKAKVKEKKEKKQKDAGKKDAKAAAEAKAKPEKKDEKKEPADAAAATEKDKVEAPVAKQDEQKEPAEKKLKGWQDDELEVDSGDEKQAASSSRMQALSSVADKSVGHKDGEAKEEELDPLDMFMADLAKQEQEQRPSAAPAEQGLSDGAHMGVMDASRVKTITLEEVQALMGIGKEPVEEPAGAAEAAPTTGTPGAGAASAGAAGAAAAAAAAASPAPPEAAKDKLDADPMEEEEEEEEDDEFHKAFMAEMKKLRGEAEQKKEEFEKADVFAGAKPGMVFKLGRLGLGYYTDNPPVATVPAPPPSAAAKAKPTGDTAKSQMPLPFSHKPAEIPTGDDVEDGKQEDDDDDDEDDDDAEGEAPASSPPPDSATAEAAASSLAGAAAEASPSSAAAGSGPQAQPEKVVETKKEKRRKRKEAKLAEAKAKEEAAKQKAKEGFGREDEERMESDADRSEDSQEEVQESYFDLVKRFTTKKTLPEVDHTKMNYKPYRKNLYIQVREITNMKDHEVDDFRRTHGDIRVRGKHCPNPIKSFLQCGLPDKILKIMEKRDYETPFPIQMQAIPALMCGRDMIGVAQTGSGKTLAYLLPMIRHVLDQPKIQDGDGPIGFIVAPTRELALQIQREANTFCKAVNLVSVCAYGGGPMGEQLSALKKGAELLVGTPGRLIDVLTTSNGKITNLRRVTFLVLDEADRMFDMGFEPQIGMFLQTTRPDKQVAMFSATLPTHVEALARQVLKKPLEITVGERNTAATNVTQFVEVLDECSKFYRLLQLLGEWHEHGSIIIFVHQQKDVDEMFTELLKYGYPPLALHGGQDQHDRDFTLQDFKDGVSNILIATSVAARGIDVKSVILVINFKVPDHLEDYIHRIGRTGRAGKAGFAYTFIQPDEADRAQDMVDALRQCGQEVPQKLKKLAEDHQAAVNTGQAQKRRRWGGFGGKGFKYDNTEKSRQQMDRVKAKKDLLIGDADERQEEEEEFHDPWLDDKPMNKKKKGDGKGKDKDGGGGGGGGGGGQPQQASASSSSAPAPTTVAAAAQVAERLRNEAQTKEQGEVVLTGPSAARPEAMNTPGEQGAFLVSGFVESPMFQGAKVGMVFKTGPNGLGYYPDQPPVPGAESPAGGAPPPPPGAAAARVVPPKVGLGAPPKAGAPVAPRKTEKEIEEMAQQMAEDTLKALPDDVREQKLPALALKLREKLRKAEEERFKQASAAAAPAPPVPPPPPKAPGAETPAAQASLVPGVLGSPNMPQNMVTKSIEQLQAGVTRVGLKTASEAERIGLELSGALGPVAPNGMHMDELEINDYPQVARQKISHRDPLQQIEELSGAKVQVKGQHFGPNAKMPEGARKLYVEIVGPTVVSVQKGKQEVLRMMEALAIRTLNIPGLSRAVAGTPGRYDPAVGK